MKTTLKSVYFSLTLLTIIFSLTTASKANTPGFIKVEDGRIIPAQIQSDHYLATTINQTFFVDDEPNDWHYCPITEERYNHFENTDNIRWNEGYVVGNARTIVWKGQFILFTSEVITFTIPFDQWVELYIDGTAVFIENKADGQHRERNVLIQLSKGIHDIERTYYDDYEGGGDVSLLWSSSSIPFSFIGPAVLSSPIASFEYSGIHDWTTRNRNVFWVITKDVDKKPLVGGWIKFDASSSKDPDGQIVEYIWKVDDVPLSTPDQIIGLQLPSPSSYKVSLTVVDDTGLTDETSQDIDLTLEPGDLIFIRTALWSTGFLFQQYTHVGMYCGDNILVETTLLPAHGGPAGVHTNPVSGYAYPTETFATAYRVVTATDEEKKLACEFALQRVGRGYDMNVKRKQLDGPTYYCSELIWAAYSSATNGRINLGNRPGTRGVWPDHIVRDIGNVSFIGGHWEHYPH